jgi:hypothetical protein
MTTPQQPRTVRATRSIQGLSQPPRGAATAGTPVNPASRAVNPKEQYPLHYDLLMRDLYSLGLVPEQWKVVAADEVRLDESGMDVEFALVESKQDLVRRRRVNVQHGKLVAIRDC